ncbi:hypothetical protein FOXYSP1_15851 [Fusarium oxysporum f. sp. phaseoli]
MKREIPMVVLVLTTLLRLLEFLRHLIFHVALWGYLRLSSMAPLGYAQYVSSTLHGRPIALLTPSCQFIRTGKSMSLQNSSPKLHSYYSQDHIHPASL